MNNKFMFLLYCICMTDVPAQEIAVQKRLTLDQVIIRVLEGHPKLKIADYEAQAMAARMRHALQSPADRISATLENFAGTGETVAIRGIETTFSFSRTLELGNKAITRGSVVQAEEQLLRNRKDIDRLNLLADAALMFLHVAADQDRLELAEEAMELVRQTEKTVQQRIQSGRIPQAEQHRVVIDLANQELELEHVRHELENSRVGLSTFWSGVEPDFDRVDADILIINPLPDFNELKDLLDRNPVLIQHLRAEDLAKAKVRLMQSKTKPDVDLSAGIRYLGGSNDVAAMLWASIPLGSASRAQPGIDEAEALSRIEPLNMEHQRLKLYATLFEIYLEMKHASEAVTILNVRIIPSAEQMLKDYEDGYQTGRYSLLELIQAQQLLRNARSQLLEMAASFHTNRIEIDRLTGAQLTHW